MSVKRPWPVGTRVRRKSGGQLTTVFESQEYGYGLRYEDYSYYYELDMHEIHGEWEPLEPVKKPVKGICIFLRKHEVSSS